MFFDPLKRNVLFSFPHWRNDLFSFPLNINILFCFPLRKNLLCSSKKKCSLLLSSLEECSFSFTLSRTILFTYNEDGCIMCSVGLSQARHGHCDYLYQSKRCRAVFISGTLGQEHSGRELLSLSDDRKFLSTSHILSFRVHIQCILCAWVVVRKVQVQVQGRQVGGRDGWGAQY